MKIGVDATCWGNKRGFGRFTRELLEATLEVDESNEYLFFIDRDAAEIETFPERAETIVADTKISPIKAAAANGRRSVKDLWAMSRAVWRHELDVFFFPAVYSYFPVFNRTKIVVTIHDMIADHNPKLIFPDAKSKFFWKIKQNAAVRQADLILTVSEHSKRQIAEYFNLPPELLRVVGEAARPVFRILPQDAAMTRILRRYGLRPDEEFLLYVGGISPHKNLETLIEAFNEIAANPVRSALKLVLVGDYKDDPFFSAYPALKKRIDELGIKDRVIFTGFVPDEDLALLYNAAALLVFPSFEEGFGLPAMEAMACGTPVAASETGSLPEVLGAAGKFFDPRDAKDMAETIEQILGGETLKRQMKAAGLERAKNSSWQSAARGLIAVFDELTAEQNTRRVSSSAFRGNSTGETSAGTRNLKRT